MPGSADERRAEKRQRTETAAAWKERHAHDAAPWQAGEAGGSSSRLIERRDSQRRQREDDREPQSPPSRQRLDHHDRGTYAGTYRSRLPPAWRNLAQREPTGSDLIHEAFHAKKADALALYGGPQYARFLQVPIKDNKYPLDLKLYTNVLAGAMTQLGKTALSRKQVGERTAQTQEALAQAAAHCLQHRGVFLDSNDWRQNAMFCNAFSKVEKEACRQACGYLASRFQCMSNKQLDKATAQTLSLLSNGFSKFMNHRPCKDALARLGDYVASDPQRRIEDFNEQELASLANAFGKLLEDDACKAALIKLARAIRRRTDSGGMDRFNEQALANLANAFGKLPEDNNCKAALIKLAGAVRHRAGSGGIDRFNEQALANLANAFGKAPEDGNCKAALIKLAGTVRRRADSSGIDRFNEQNLANLANAFCKLPEDDDCKAALIKLASAVRHRADSSGMDRFNEQELANLANAFGKLPENDACKAALIKLAGTVRHRADSGGIDRFNEQDLANLANAFCKLPEDGNCKAALIKLASAVRRRTDSGGMDRFNEQELANMANAFCKSSSPECLAANTRIARHLLDVPACLASVKMQSLSMLAHAFACHFNGADEQGKTVLEAALRALVPPAVSCMPNTDVIAVANLLRAYNTARLTKELTSLAEATLPRITALIEADGLCNDDLETMGTLCAGLTPLVRSDDLRRFRRDALRLLQQLRPIITRKLDLYLAQQQSGGDAPPPDEACATRCPALSAYQILKAYVQVRSHWTGREAGMCNVQAATGAAELDAWLKEVYARTAPLIERDLSSYSWNMIAQLESEDPAEALDRFIIEHSEQIARRYTPAVFDHDRVFDSFDHNPRPPKAGAGLLSIPTVDPLGKILHTAPPRYSLFARLTQGQIQPLWVQLPERFSSFLLARTFMYDGKPYRFDLVGGSRMKAGRRDIAQLFAPNESKPSPGMLLALPAAETLPGSAYGRMMAEMFPNEESFYYFQRALMGSPPALASAVSASTSTQEVALTPPSHVLEGRFRVALLPDRRPADEAVHPFAMANERGQSIALRPFDGCGFIREDVARRMPAFAHALRYGHETESAHLPAQALQHYLRSEAVAEEATGRMIERLEAQGKPPTPEQVFRSLSAGLVKGDIGVAVPSADSQVHLSHVKSGAFRRHGGDLLIGKSPYDKPNLGWFAHEQVHTNDATSRFLDRCTTLQYSFWIKTDHSAGKPLKAFAKGLLIAVPEHMWPAAFSDVDMCLSAEDVKMQSDWRDEKKRAMRDVRLAGVGQLQAGDLFAGGSLVALPPEAQQKRDGDFDGDPLLILAGYPHLAEDVRRYNEREEALGLPSLKPPKSHTPAIGPDGQYRHGRTLAIMSMQLNVLTDFVGLQYLFLALPREQRRRFAEQALFGVLEGWEPSRKDSEGKWRPGLRPLVGQMRDAETGQDRQAALEKAATMLRRQHDATRQPQARQAAALLAQAVGDWVAAQWPGKTVPELELAVPPADPAFEALFPGLRAELDAQPDPVLRMDTLLQRVPNHVPMPGQHWQVPGDAEASLNRLLAMGVKIGTDALKSNTGTKQARRTADYLCGLYNRMYGGMQPPPYTKMLARQIRDGRFDAQAVLGQLTDNPTLAAQIMEKAIARLEKKGWLPRPDGAPMQSGASAQPASMAEYQFTSIPENSRNRRELEGVSLVIRKRAFHLEKTVTPVLSELFATLGAREHKPADRLKSDWAIKDKIGRAYPGRRSDVTQAQADACVRDGLRYAIVFDEAGFTHKALQALEKLRAQFDMERVKNTFTEGSVYKGINITLRDKESGASFEIQFHTEASIRVKGENHHWYRQSLNPHLGREEHAQLQRKMQERSSRVALPPDVERIVEEPGQRRSADGEQLQREMRKRSSTAAALPARTERIAQEPGRHRTTDGEQPAPAPRREAGLAQTLRAHFSQRQGWPSQRQGKPEQR